MSLCVFLRPFALGDIGGLIGGIFIIPPIHELSKMLSDIRIRNAKPQLNIYKRSDSDGLYLFITAT